MIKIALKYLLAAWLLLFCGYGQSSAQNTAQNSKGSSYTQPCIFQNTNPVFFRCAWPGIEKPTHKFILENEEDDELVSIKKHLKNGSCPATIFSSQLTGLSFSEKLAPHYRYFTHSTSSRCILFQVFRI